MYSNRNNMTMEDIIKPYFLKNKVKIGKKLWNNINPIRGKSLSVEKAFDV